MNVATKPADNLRNALPLVTPDQLAIDFAHVIKAVDELEARISEAPPVLEDDDDLKIVTGLIGDFGKYAKRVDTIRDDQKRPHLDAGNVIQTFFKALENRLLVSKKSLEQRGTTYLNKKAEAERRQRLAQEAKDRAIAEAEAREAAEALKQGDVASAHVAQTAAAAADRRANHAADAASAKPAELARTATDAGTATLQQVWDFDLENIDIVDLEALRPFLPRTAIEQAIRAFIKSGRRELKGARIFSKNAGRFRT